MTSLWALALLAVLGLTGSHAAPLQISVGEQNVTNVAYLVRPGGSATFNCSGGLDLTWFVLSTMPVSYEETDNVYQKSSSEGGQLLNVQSFHRELGLIYTCKAADSSQADVDIVEDILDRVVVLNSTAVEVHWSTKPNTGLVQCCPGYGMTCLTANADNTLDSFVFSGLEEYTSYAVSIVGESNEVFITTYQDRPSAEPQNITVFIDHSLGVTVTWGLPIVEERNGIVISYQINCTVSGSTGSLTTDTIPVENAAFDSPSEHSHYISAERNSTYVCWVSAATVNGSGPASMPINVTVELPVLTVTNNGDDSVVVSWEVPHVVAGARSLPSSANLIYQIVGSRETKMSTSVPVNRTDWTISNLAEGMPYNVTVEVGVSNIVSASESTFFFAKELQPRIAVTGLSAGAVNTTAIQVNWTELTLKEARGFPIYIIHIERTGGLWSNDISVTIPPATITGLLPGSQYTVQVNVSTGAGIGATASSPVSVSTESEEIPTSDGTTAPLIEPVAVGVGVGAAVIALVIAAGLFLVVFTTLCFLRWRSIQKSRGVLTLYDELKEPEGQVLYVTGHGTPTNTPPANRESVLFGDRYAEHLKEMMQMPVNGRECYENTRPPVKVSEFPEYCQRMRADNSYIVEFECVPKVDPSAPNSDALTRANQPKNRYPTIVPYDQSRVILSGRNSYINASFVNGYRREKEYIATQGPLEGTVSDFWRMIWEQRCSVIAMLTNLTEGSNVKCHKYWGNELNKLVHFPNGISVCQEEHKIFAEYESRIFTVTHKSHPELPALTVNHFQYTAWPDYHVPRYSASLVRFVQTVRHVYKDLETPMVVHCSAGVGRTGTFIAVDAMMQRMKERDDISIYEFLHEMRNCRMYLVMNVEQYEFIHEALCGFAVSGDTYINATEFDKVLAELKGSSYTAIDEQFQLLDQLSRKPAKEDDVFAEEHVQDNRYETRYPYVSNHVAISATGVCNKYINAAPIDSYSKRHAFIAAEAPSFDKMELVLEVIAQKQCRTLVVLCTEEEMKEVSFCKFWPVEESANTSFGQYSLHLTNQYSKDMLTVLKITLKRTEGVEHQFTLIHIHGWSENNEPDPLAVLSAIQEYEKAQMGKTAPAVVMCSDGMGRTGAFICMCSEVERIRMEGMADVFQSVKAARNQRPYMVSTVEQYVLIHEVLLCFLNTFRIYDNFGSSVRASTDGL